MAYQRGTRISGSMTEVDTSQVAELGVIYEDVHIPGRALTQSEIQQSVDQVYTQKWFQGAQVNWVYADSSVVRCQFSYPAASYIEPATIIAIITAIAAILAAIATIVWSMTAYKVVTSVPPEAWDWIVKGSIIVAALFGTAAVLRAFRGK
jgi:hypothetical protein